MNTEAATNSRRSKAKAKKTRKTETTTTTSSKVNNNGNSSSGSKGDGGGDGGGDDGGGAERAKSWVHVRKTQKVVNAFGLTDSDLAYLKKNTRYNEQEIK